MPTKIVLENTIQNTSLQVGDVAYYVPNVVNESSNNASIKNSGDDPIELGKITRINEGSIHVDTIGSGFQIGDFVMFSKNKLANNTSLLGYYADVKLVNNSTDKAELFSIGSEISQSSK